MDICERTSLLPGSCVCLGHPAVIGVSPVVPATDNTSLGSVLVAMVNLLNPALIVVHGPADLVAVSPDATESIFINAVRTTVCSPSAFSDSGLRCRVVGQVFTPEYLASGAATYARSYATP